MRSNERAGIVSVIMLFLWGTLLTEPFHIFADYIAGSGRLAAKGLGGGDTACAITSYAVLLLVIVILQKLITTKAETYIPCAVAIASAVMLFYIVKAEKALKWAAAVYTYSISTAMLTSLVFVPLSKMNKTLDKILYITRYNGIHLTGPFAGLAGLPELVWGLFFAIVASFPIVFFATQKGKD